MKKVLALIAIIVVATAAVDAQRGQQKRMDIKCGQYNYCTFTSTGSAQWEFSDWKQWGAQPITTNPFTRPMSTHSPVDGSTPYTTVVVNLATNDTGYVECKTPLTVQGSCRQRNRP